MLCAKCSLRKGWLCGEALRDSLVPVPGESVRNGLQERSF